MDKYMIDLVNNVQYCHDTAKTVLEAYWQNSKLMVMYIY